MHRFDEQYPEETAKIDECIYKLQKFVVRRWLLDEGKRVDGRGIDEIRPLAAEVGLIPRVHGSAMFTRGQTQVMTITTLGPLSDAQILDGIDNEEASAICTSTTSRPTRSVKPSLPEVPVAARLVTEHWQSAHSSRSSRR